MSHFNSIDQWISQPSEFYFTWDKTTDFAAEDNKDIKTKKKLARALQLLVANPAANFTSCSIMDFQNCGYLTKLAATNLIA